jgi:predicted transposase/invertase (TIGR01784 family)
VLRRGTKEGEKIGMQKGLKKGIKEGLKEGLEKGKQEGLQTAKLETAKKMLSLNEPIEKIALITDLSIEDIEKLKQPTADVFCES